MRRISHILTLRIASTFVLAIFVLAGMQLFGQTGQVKVFLFDDETKALLINKKVSVQVNDTISQAFHYADTSGRVILNLKPGKYDLAIKPEGYGLMKVREVIVHDHEPTYLTYSFVKSTEVKRKRKKH